MFGDIESHSNSKMSSANASQRGTGSDNPAPERKSCLSRSIKDDEYAQSLANGFTIIIDSVDDTNNFEMNSSDEEDPPSDNGRNINRGPVADKSVSFVDEQTKCENKSAKAEPEKEVNDQEIDDDEIDEIINKFVAEEQSRALEKESVSEDTKGKDEQEEQNEEPKPTHKKKLTQRPTPPGTSKSKIESKNKLGLELKIENEMVSNFAPYMKSATSKSKSYTNKARQLYNISNKQKKSNGAVPSVKTNGRNSVEKSAAQKIELDKMNNAKSNRTESLTSQDTLDVCLNTADSITISNETHHKITCVADVHREKTLSPKTENGDIKSDSTARQRKISVISIGSVLKDGRETLV